MNIEKAVWHSDGGNLRLSVPFAKVDEEHRQVSGFATLNNIDKHGDIVLADASVRAFDRFRGNLREMHQAIAVGKVLSFTVEEFYDPIAEKIFSGIFVTAFVSKGAQDTWEKVLDGTLSGFSIGALVIDDEPVWDAEVQATIRIIKDYELVELSLVDNPANQLANVYSIVKMDGGEVTGAAIETQTTNVFWCQSDHEGQVAVLSKDESTTCVDCNKKMTDIGWVETSDTQKSEAVKELVNKFLNTNSVPEITKQAETDHSEGGNEVATEEIVEKTAVLEEVEEVEASEDLAEAEVEDTVEEAADEVEGKAADVSEVEDDVEPDLVKTIDGLKEFFGTELTKALGSVTEQVEAIRSQYEETTKNVDERFTSLDEKYTSLEKRVDALIGNVEGVQKALDAVDASMATKKSADPEGHVDEKVVETKSWGGHFLGARSIISE